MNVILLEACVLENLFDRFHSLLEQVHVQLLEFGPGQRLREVISVLEGFNFNPSGLLRGQSPLGLLNLPLQFAHSPEVTGNVSTGLLLVKFDEVVNDTVVEVLSPKVGITSGSQDLKHTVIDGEQGDIKGSTTEIVDDYLRFATPLVETVGDGGSGRLVDDTKDVETGDSSVARH